MKKLLLLLSIFSLPLLAQPIPNAGFENWTESSPGVFNPDGWGSLDILWDAVQRTTESHSGTYAAKLAIVDFMGVIEPPYLNGDFPANQQYGSLTGYYKFVPQNQNQSLNITIAMYREGSIINLVGSGSWETYTPVSSFTQFTIPIDYFEQQTPDSAWVIFIVDDSAETMTAGGYAIIDDLSWGSTVGVNNPVSNIPAKFEMQQNFPNPFNPSTKIDYTLPEGSFVQLKVYDIVGNELATLVNEYQPAGRFRTEFNGANLSSGIYIAKLTAGSFTKTMKMTLMK